MKHGDVTNVYCVIKLHRIENYPFDSPDRIDSVRRIDSNRFFPALVGSTVARYGVGESLLRVTQTSGCIVRAMYTIVR